MDGRRGGYQLGIDLGTTFTAAAVCRSDDRRPAEPEVVSLGSRSATIPSVLLLATDGAVVVGEAAERRAHTDPGRVVREVERRIGPRRCRRTAPTPAGRRTAAAGVDPPARPGARAADGGGEATPALPAHPSDPLDSPAHARGWSRDRCGGEPRTGPGVVPPGAAKAVRGMLTT